MSSLIDTPRLPVIDLSLFDAGDPWRDHVAAQVDWASSTYGFFYLIGHGIDTALIDSLMSSSRHFFSLNAHEQRRLQANVPHHGRNNYPELPGFRDAVQDYMTALTGLGHKLMASIGRGLGIGDSYFVDRYTGNPTALFRIFNYPATSRLLTGLDTHWGVAEHTDEGLLTLVKQDDVGGLQVEHAGRWLEVPEVPDSFVINIGGTLEHLTNGRYVSAPHRVRNDSTRDRLSMPFFFDPAFDAVLSPIEGVAAGGGALSRVSTKEGDGHEVENGVLVGGQRIHCSDHRDGSARFARARRSAG